MVDLAPRHALVGTPKYLLFVDYPTYLFTAKFTRDFFETRGFIDLGHDGMDEPVEWASPASNLSVMLGYEKKVSVAPSVDPRQRSTPIYLGIARPGGEVKEVDVREFSPRMLIVQPELASHYLTGLERRLREITVPDGMGPLRLSFESVRTGGQEWGSNKILVVEYKVTTQPPL